MMMCCGGGCVVFRKKKRKRWSISTSSSSSNAQRSRVGSCIVAKRRHRRLVGTMEEAGKLTAKIRKILVTIGCPAHVLREPHRKCNPFFFLSRFL